MGGGIIGTACAHYLAQSGRPVTIVEQGSFGRGCSHGNCGFICPSHVLPLAGPGAVGRALRSLLSRNAPFTIRFRFDLGLWSWLLQFARRCNFRAMIESGHAIQALLNSSRQLYADLFRQESIDCEWVERGLLLVFQTRNGLQEHVESDRLLHDTFGVAATHYEGDALVALEPALKPGLAGGTLYPMDAHLRPDRLLAGWRRLLESRGVEIRENCSVKGLVSEKGRARAVVTDQGELPAEAFVVATGAWTPFLRTHLGCPIPIQPGKGYSITMPRPARCPTLPLLFPEHSVGVTPMATGYRLGSTMEFAGYDATLNRRRLDLLRQGAVPYLQEPYCEPIEEEWFGWRPMTCDGKPIIDRSPALANVFIAAGHNMLGMSMAPATGKLLAELLSGETPHVDPKPYSVRRF